MSSQPKRKPEHVQRAREILALDYQDQLAIIGELLAEKELHEDGINEAYQDGLDEGNSYTNQRSGL
jgi:hypothetical protein